MTITDSNLIAHELIGLRTTISNSSDPTKIGMTGVVRNETKNTLTIQVRKRFLCIPKNGSFLTFDLPDSKPTSIDGSRLRFRPEDRVKRSASHW